MNRGLWILLVLLALVLGALALFLSQLEWVEREVAIQPTEEAARRPYLAATRFLESRGVEVVEEQGVFRLLDTGEHWLPGEDDTLVLVDAFGLLPEQKLDDLLGWVQAGGRLILSGQNPYVSAEQLQRDVIFATFGVGVERSYEHLLQDAERLRDIHDRLAPSADCASLVAPVSFRFRDDDRPVQAVFPGWQRLTLEEDRVARRLTDSFGTRLAQFEVGTGLITFVVGTELWSNAYVDCYDNGYLLWQLVGDEGRVWILRNQEAPSLWQLLWSRAWLWVLLTLLYILLFLWRQGVRFGPLLTPESSQRRSFLEHIDASARFFWRHKQSDLLVERLRDEVRDRAALRVPGFRERPAGEQQTELARLTRLPETLVERAMSADAEGDAGFVRCVQNLQQLRNNL